MELLWKQQLAAPDKPGLYPVDGEAVYVLIRHKDIKESERLNGHEIRCSCVPTITDAKGQHVWEVRRMVALEDHAHDSGSQPNQPEEFDN